MEKVVVVMPAWNEGENIGRMIEELVKKEFPKINADMHLLVVDNYSKDDTQKLVEEASKTYKNVHLIQQGKKSGLGWAYVIGMEYAVVRLGADAVIEMDADGQHPPDHVKRMVDAYLAGADYVIGSRYVPGGSVPSEWALFRKAISYFGNLYIRLVWLKLKLHDATTGFRLTKVKGVLDQIELNKLMALDRFAYKIHLLHDSLKIAKNVKEVPLKFASRIKEKSKFNIKEMITSYKVATILGLRDKQRFIKFGTVGFIGYLVNAFGLWFFARNKFPEWAIWATATELAIINNFILNNIWTFKSEKIKGIGKLLYKFFQFNLTSAGALVIQTVFGTLGVKFFGPQSRQLLLPFIIVLLVLPYNYFMYNAVIWKTWKFPTFGKSKDKSPS